MLKDVRTDCKTCQESEVYCLGYAEQNNGGNRGAKAPLKRSKLPEHQSDFSSPRQHHDSNEAARSRGSSPSDSSIGASNSNERDSSRCRHGEELERHDEHSENLKDGSGSVQGLLHESQCCVSHELTYLRRSCHLWPAAQKPRTLFSILWAHRYGSRFQGNGG